MLSDDMPLRRQGSAASLAEWDTNRHSGSFYCPSPDAGVNVASNKVGVRRLEAET